MRLPIPVQVDGKVFTDVKVKEANAGVVADTRREAESGAIYSSLLVWCVGVVEEISSEDETITDLSEIKRIVRMMPFESAYALACYGMAETKGDDSIPGVYECPKCKATVRAEKYEEDGEEIDNTDHLKLIEYEVCDRPQDGISISLDKPVEIKRRDNGEVQETIESISMDYPTIGQCIRAHQKTPDDDSKMQFVLYADSVKLVNGQKPNPNWKTSYGDITFSRMSMRDLSKITDALKKYAIDTRVERVCLKCHNRWKADIDLNGFFGSGLKQ